MTCLGGGVREGGNDDDESVASTRIPTAIDDRLFEDARAGRPRGIDDLRREEARRHMPSLWTRDLRKVRHVELVNA